MAATFTVDAFLDVVRRSRLVRPEELERILKELEASGVDASSPKALAQALTDRQVVTRWQADYLLQGKHKGFFLGPYRFLKLLGKGGMGAVYLAQHEMMKRRCAIKVLPAKLLKDKSSVLERFYLEAQAVASLDHPNIVRAYDVNKEVQGSAEIHYLVMEYVEGCDLQTIVEERGGGLSFLEVADYARQAALGLAHAHENALIHRDIKPANLLVDGKGIVKILDLGLARFFDDRLDASLTKAYNESILGTADYLSPEQALNSHQVDTRTDIYSLGCTCYFLVTAQPPFPEGSVAQRLIAHQVKSPAPMESLRSEVPSDLASIIEKMIAKKPENRYQTAGEVAEALRAWLQGHADSAWKQQHRDALGEDSGVLRSAGREPTRARASANEDTELELGLAPTDDVATPASTPSQPSSGGSRGSSRDLTRETPVATPAASDLEPIPSASSASAASLDESFLPQSLDDLFSETSNDPLAGDVFGTTPLPSPLGPAGSGAYGTVVGSQSPPATSESRQLVWLLLIGLGISIPLAVVILVIAFWMEKSSVDSEANSPGVSAPVSVPPRYASQEQPKQPSPPASAGTASPLLAAPSPPSTPQPGQLPQTPPPASGQLPRVTGATPGGLAVPDAGAPQPAQSQPPQNPPGGAAPDTAVSGANSPSSVPQRPAQWPGQSPEGPAQGGDRGEGAKTPLGAQPKEKKSDELTEPERLRLLAAVGNATISVMMEREPKHKVDVMVVRACYDAWEKEGVSARIGGTKDDPVICKLTVTSDQPNPNSNVVTKVTAELQLLLDGKRVVIWKLSGEFGEMSLPLYKRDMVPSVHRTSAANFFRRMIQDYRAAIAAQPDM